MSFYIKSVQLLEKPANELNVLLPKLLREALIKKVLDICNLQLSLVLVDCL